MPSRHPLLYRLLAGCGGGVDRRQLAQSLPQLPETEDELKAVAANLDASPWDIFLGRDATVTAVKRAPLSDFRVVYFATHVSRCGDVKRPGRARRSRSPSRQQPSDFDDGLLTASQLPSSSSTLTLWCCLCQHDRRRQAGAEALSGLARAFFYSGARALLVSHWSVASDAATRFMTGTFDTLNANPALAVPKRCDAPCWPSSTISRERPTPMAIWSRSRSSAKAELVQLSRCPPWVDAVEKVGFSGRRGRGVT